DQADDVAAVAVLGMHPDVAEGVFELRVLGSQRGSEVASVELGGVEIGSAGDGILDREIKVLVGLIGSHIGNVVGLAVGGVSHGLALSRNVLGLHAVGFFQNVAQERGVHGRNRGEQLPGSDVVEPGVVGLAFAFVVAGLLEIPEAVMAGGRLGADLQPG